MIIGITGPSGSGKSTVSSMLRLKGYEVIDADAVAKEVKLDHIKDIKALFGDKVLTDGKFDNKKLAKLVFNDSDAKNQLNNLLFPPIVAKLKGLTQNKGKMTFVDIPVLFGSGAEPLFGAVIAINADRETRLRRLIEGRGIDPEIAAKQVDSITITYQNSAMCDMVLWNNTNNTKDIEKKIDAWIEEQKEDKYATK